MATRTDRFPTPMLQWVEVTGVTADYTFDVPANSILQWGWIKNDGAGSVNVSILTSSPPSMGGPPTYSQANYPMASGDIVPLCFVNSGGDTAAPPLPTAETIDYTSGAWGSGSLTIRALYVIVE